MAHFKTIIVEVKAQENCLARALIVAIARVENNADYTAYRKGRKIHPVVQLLLRRVGIDLTNSGGIPELNCL